jgi:hypothetical protein
MAVSCAELKVSKHSPEQPLGLKLLSLKS